MLFGANLESVAEGQQERRGSHVESYGRPPKLALSDHERRSLPLWEFLHPMTSLLANSTRGCRTLLKKRAAESHGDVPVGAVVIHRHSVIASRHNERELTGDPTSHAEVLALRDAANVIGNWHLEECLLVVTLEPCVMCAGAMVNSRLGMLVFARTTRKLVPRGVALMSPTPTC